MITNSFLCLIIFLFGLSVGSFLNSVIYRLYSDEKFLFDRSYCPYCKHKLSWQDLIPLLSFLILKGKCRYCHQPISLQYPSVELATGILFVLIVIHTLPNLLFTFYYLLITCFLIIVFIYDFKHYIVPDKIIYPAITITFIFNIFYSIFIINNLKFIIQNLLSAFGPATFFLAIVLISRGKWMGLGDAKLAFFIGFFLGFPSILVALFLAFFIGAIIGLGLILSGQKTLKSEVPFGPFLVIGAFTALFFGQNIIDWYFSLFNLI